MEYLKINMYAIDLVIGYIVEEDGTIEEIYEVEHKGEDITDLISDAMLEAIEAEMYQTI